MGLYSSALLLKSPEIKEVSLASCCHYIIDDIFQVQMSQKLLWAWAVPRPAGGTTLPISHPRSAWGNVSPFMLLDSFCVLISHPVSVAQEGM